MFPHECVSYDAIFAPGNLVPLPAARKTVLFVQNAHVVPQLAWREEYRNNKRRLQRLMARSSIRRAGRVLFISEALKSWGRPYWSVNRLEPGVAYPGVSLRAGPVRAARGHDVLMVGNLVPHKRVDLAVRAFARLTHSSASAGRLRIAGSEGSPGLMHRLREAAVRVGVGDRVDFLGFVAGEALAHAYATSGCYLSTSALEAFPFPPLEAMAAGTPAVVPDAAPFREVCGTAGVYFPDDEDAIANRLANVRKSPMLDQTLSREARERAAMFSWAAFGEKLALALTAVADERASRGREAA
jgi:glycosyltransferase involved in cell wall biosynthesis